LASERAVTFPFTTRADSVTARPNEMVWNATLPARAPSGADPIANPSNAVAATTTDLVARAARTNPPYHACNRRRR